MRIYLITFGLSNSILEDQCLRPNCESQNLDMIYESFHVKLVEEKNMKKKGEKIENMCYQLNK